MTRIIAILSAILVIALCGAIYVVTMGRGGDDRFAQCRASAVAGGAGQIGGPFTLVDETGQTVTDVDVIDEPTLIYFGYTYCPDICPYDAARNAEAVTILEEQGKIVKPVFISIDPERDTPEQLADFTDYLHPRMLGLTGSPEQVAAASKAYRTYFKKQPSEDGDDYYLVDHSTFSYLTLPGEGFVEFFRRDIPADKMAEQIGCFLDAM
ncbi:SCO family protein [Pseudooceanicola nitratireducens]|jgi:protein SCO1/2|uniref:SCO family protein n=1 Tax=Pseudooceanicola nitratireducens TaxID=517719 RepID=UPI001C94A8AF|nr:SCO family protein [Pseudooceanicola nitratireducens]MEC7297639.1 SCO family protein [Pseudomonadota bacterium]MBY6155767.1 SCO family protein [Pseudooceanicola nitratireducens]MBY6167390.1 SCO family protein [Pseudooceanicola nitratireducens]MEC7794770.1 SCO family protein [Pseudomonadota bacterium]MEC8668655.1 SCO family protein [Pseudomonadota bacterium]